LDNSTGNVRHVPFAPGMGLVLLVIDTQVRHALADGWYAKRRQAGEQARNILGVSQLTQIALNELDPALARVPKSLRPIVHHVVTEQHRTADAVRALQDQDWTAFGELMNQSHASLRDDYRVSCPESDLAVDTAVRCNALGARMTGGGFGGCVIALVGADRLHELRHLLDANFSGAGFAPPATWVAEASDGARRDR
jgi:galactokinase